jgi:hypothetical protein
MIVKHEDDFPRLRAHIKKYRRRFPMFSADIRRIETNIESSIKTYSEYMIKYRRTKSELFYNDAHNQLESISQLVKLIDQIELVAILSRR